MYARSSEALSGILTGMFKYEDFMAQNDLNNKPNGSKTTPPAGRFGLIFFLVILAVFLLIGWIAGKFSRKTEAETN